jgi:hypothetical protein
MGCCSEVFPGNQHEGLKPLLLEGNVPTVNEFMLQSVVAVAHELPVVAGGVTDVTHTWKLPFVPLVSIESQTCVPGV